MVGSPYRYFGIGSVSGICLDKQLTSASVAPASTANPSRLTGREPLDAIVATPEQVPRDIAFAMAAGAIHGKGRKLGHPVLEIEHSGRLVSYPDFSTIPSYTRFFRASFSYRRYVELTWD